MGDRVGVEVLYNSVKTEVKTVAVTVGEGVIDEMWLGKPHPAEGALGNPDGVWGPEKLLIRCSKERQHPAEWTPGPQVEHQENEKDTTLTAIKVGVKILLFMFGHQLPLTRKPWITFSNPCNKVKGKYFVKEVFLRLFIYCVVRML